MAKVFVNLHNGSRVEAETSNVPLHLQAKVFGLAKPSTSKISRSPLLMLESRQPLELCA